MKHNAKKTDSGRHSRRDFLKSPAAAAVGASVAGYLTIARTAHAGGDETIKMALIGCGGRGTGAACQALSTRGPVKLWAMADMFRDRLEASLANLTAGQEAAYDRAAHQGFGSKVDVPPERRFVGFEAYKQAIDNAVDLVMLVSPPHFRPMHYEYAVKQGKHVFMEKPVAVDAPGIRQLLAANKEAKKKNLKVVVGLQRRHHLIYQETIKRLGDGAIGHIVLIRCYWNRSSIYGSPLRPDMTEMEYQLRNPYVFTWLGGDHIVDAHVHNLDVCNWLKGGHPVTAQGQGGRQVHAECEYGDIYDHHCVEFTYEDGTKMFGQARSISGCWNRVSEHVHGTRGYAEIGRGRIEGASAWRFRASFPNPYQVEHDVLMDAIRQDEPHNEAEYAATSTMTAILGRMASYSGQMIGWDDAINSTVSLRPSEYAFDATPPVVADATGRYPVAMPGITKVH
jgi:myo-inositol 2-dehydrogenase/D-chiro-inositol 1-dehydrogenase